LHWVALPEWQLALHDKLEQDLADFAGKEAGLVFSTGMQANLGAISALIGRGDVVITDREDHASIVDGCRLGFGEMKRFRHSDMQNLEETLQSCGDQPKLVVVDGVFSMGGDIAPLPEIVTLCEKYGARLMVDDAHSLGVLAEGRGTAAHFGLTAKTDLIMGTFSKSFASLGGVILGDFQVIDYIKHNARSLIFSLVCRPRMLRCSRRAGGIKRSGARRSCAGIGENRRAIENWAFDRQQPTPIVPIFIGDDMKTFALWKAFLRRHLVTRWCRPPCRPIIVAAYQLNGSHTMPIGSVARDVQESRQRAGDYLAHTLRLS
jgi:7-keto-8-aminopelargonate synthetase-like enzyme